MTEFISGFEEMMPTMHRIGQASGCAFLFTLMMIPIVWASKWFADKMS